MMEIESFVTALENGVSTRNMTSIYAFIDKFDNCNFEAKRIERYCKKVKDHITKTYCLDIPRSESSRHVFDFLLLDEITAWFLESVKDENGKLYVDKDERSERGVDLAKIYMGESAFAHAASTLSKESVNFIINCLSVAARGMPAEEELNRLSESADTEKVWVCSQGFNEDIRIDDYNIVYEAYEKEFQNVCVLFLRYKFAQNPSLGADNCFKELPNEEEALILMCSLANRMVSVIDNICIKCTPMIDWMYSQVKQNDHRVLDEFNKKIEDMQECLRQQNAEIERLKAENKKLQNRIDNTKNIKKDISDDFNEQVRSVLRALKRAEGENEKLKNQIKAFRNNDAVMLEFQDKDREQEQENRIDVDMNGRYLFILGRETTFQTVITENFPNAIIYKGQNLTTANIDLAVCFTSTVDHSVYYGIKARCKNAGIPFIHCPNNNIDIVKEMMRIALDGR